MMAEPCASESSAGTESDQDFDPTAEMLVDDFDDEKTMDEQELLEEEEGVAGELDDLQKEGTMPLEELLAMYGCCNQQNVGSLQHVSVDLPEERFNKDISKEAEWDEVDDGSRDNDVFEGGEHTNSTHLLRSVSHASMTSESDSGDDYSVGDDWRKTIQVGSDFQAVVPEGLCKYDDAPAYENEDRLLWDPSKLSDKEVELYLQQAQNSYPDCQGVQAIPLGSHIRDDEQLLYLLLQCGHNVEEALRRRRMQPSHLVDTMSLWSEEECRSFENGLRTYGKDFHLLHQNNVRTRSVGELVQFYYFWKKTERHDVFASKNRLEKKKYALHPGTTDYMDRFLDEQENSPTQRDQSSSPFYQRLLSGESKRQGPSPSTATEKNESIGEKTNFPFTRTEEGKSANFHEGAKSFEKGVDSVRTIGEGMSLTHMNNGNVASLHIRSTSEKQPVTSTSIETLTSQPADFRNIYPIKRYNEGSAVHSS
ncbi:mesoderm induction early response protein 1-like [Limulus polyphemus]|uniref:Mesoderm induction early response protein 1-like n=1 Tax=Limulus polyphemus TaxID=6850 RepID=A0ABM1BGN1_LIMPO|nr:mesoderm induction early response protein 1-like [Limulus polyphemus]